MTLTSKLLTFAAFDAFATFFTATFVLVFVFAFACLLGFVFVVVLLEFVFESDSVLVVFRTWFVFVIGAVLCIERASDKDKT